MITTRTLKNGHARYDFRGRLTDGRVHNKTFRTRAEAKHYEARFIGDRASGFFLDPKRGELAFGAWATQLLDDEAQWKTLRSRTRDRSVFATRLGPALGELPLNRVSAARVQAVVKSWVADGLKPSTVRTYYAVLRSILQVAVDAELIPRNPASRTKLPPLKRTPRRISSPDDTMHVAEALGPEWRRAAFTITATPRRLSGSPTASTPALRSTGSDMRPRTSHSTSTRTFPSKPTEEQRTSSTRLSDKA